MLKRCFLIAALLACASVFALQGKLMFTLAPNVPDQFVHIMPFRPPVIPFVGKCVRNQPVALHLVLANPASDKDGKVLVEIESIRIVDPQGKEKEFVGSGKPMVALQGVKKTKRDFSGVLLAGIWSLSAEDGDPLGKTRATVKLRDRGDGSTLECSAEIELVDKLPDASEKPMTDRELGAFLTNYYLKPAPGKIPAAFEAFLRFDKKNCGVKKDYDPLMWLCGFSALYKLNPQLRPALIRGAEKYPAVHKMYVAMILIEAGVPESELKDADPELKANFDKIKSEGKSPLAFAAVSSPSQLDALWAAFFATGGFEPIRRLVGELRKRENVMTLEEVKKLGRKPDPAEMKKIANGLIGRAAEWSLVANARQHRLVAYYLEAMLLRKEYPDRAAAVKLGAILIKAGLLEVATTPDDKKVLRSVLRPKKRAAKRGYNPLGK